MAANVRIVLNHAAIREIERSQRVLADLEKRAQRIAAAAGPDHEVESQVGRNRARASVRTTHPVGPTGRANLKRAIQAGR